MKSMDGNVLTPDGTGSTLGGRSVLDAAQDSLPTEWWVWNSPVGS